MWSENGTDGGGRRRRRSSVWRIFVTRLIVIGIMLVSAAGMLLGMLHKAGQPGPLTRPVTVLVERGDSTERIATKLEQKGVISSRYLMLAYLAWERFAGHKVALKAGEYAFQPGVSLRDVVRELQTGRGILHRLTIPEGLSTVQVLARIREHPALKGHITLVPDEGTLLPDTYLFTRGKTRDDIIHQMMEAQRKLLAELWPRRREDLPLKTPREAVILASIVEKETAVAEERARIAAVFINRLKKGMRLQADPTVIYGITKGWPLGRPLSKKDLRTPTPWNTYVIKGLPPTPIANPGRASIEAVLNPADTNELYFVADGTGRHVFAADLKTHQQNVRKLRRLEQERAKGRDKQQADRDAEEKPAKEKSAEEKSAKEKPASDETKAAGGKPGARAGEKK